MSSKNIPSADNVCSVSPPELKLRFYGHRTLRWTWIAVCIDLNLAVERPTWESALEAVREQARGYINAVLETDDKSSISYLLHRPAPWIDHLLYHVACTVCLVRQVKQLIVCLNETFFVPVPLSQYSPA
jgi:hypothetical protein